MDIIAEMIDEHEKKYVDGNVTTGNNIDGRELIKEN